MYLGRLAGRAATGGETVGRTPVAVPPPAKAAVSPDPAYRERAITVPPDALTRLTEAKRPGYWHFEEAHRVVLERALDCTACHTPDWPTVAPATAAQQQAQLNACGTCH